VISLKGIKIKGKELIGKKAPLKKNSKVLFATDKGDYRVFPVEEEKEK